MVWAHPHCDGWLDSRRGVAMTCALPCRGHDQGVPQFIQPLGVTVPTALTSTVKGRIQGKYRPWIQPKGSGPPELARGELSPSSERCRRSSPLRRDKAARDPDRQANAVPRKGHPRGIPLLYNQTSLGALDIPDRSWHCGQRTLRRWRIPGGLPVGRIAQAVSGRPLNAAATISGQGKA